jgi:hypothetical protein
VCVIYEDDLKIHESESEDDAVFRNYDPDSRFNRALYGTERSRSRSRSPLRRRQRLFDNSTPDLPSSQTVPVARAKRRSIINCGGY